MGFQSGLGKLAFDLLSSDNPGLFKWYYKASEDDQAQFYFVLEFLISFQVT